MAKFMNVDNMLVVNVDEIHTIERMLFNLDKRDFEVEDTDTKEISVLEFYDFVLARIYCKNGEVQEIMTNICLEDDYAKEIDKRWKELIGGLDYDFIKL